MIRVLAAVATGLALMWPGSLEAQTTVSASLRVRVEHWDWFTPARADPTYSYLGLLGRAGLTGRSGSWSWNLEVAAPALIGLPSGSVGPAPEGQLGLGATYWAANDSTEHAVGLFLKQAAIRFGSSPGAPGGALRVGRFDFVEGTETAPLVPTLAALKRDRIAHRLIGNFGWSHAQRSFDGLQFSHAGSRYQLTSALLRPTQGVFSVNGWRSLDVGVGYASIGNRASAQQKSDWRGFILYYRDYRDPAPLKSDNRPLAARQSDQGPIRIGTVGGHYVRTAEIAGAAVDVLGWGAFQMGDWGAQEHRAYAFSAELGVQPRVRFKPWLRTGLARSSGDASSADQEHGTFFQVLPTPRWYARFPFYNAMNLTDAFASLAVSPTARISFRLEAHLLRLSESSDLWYSGGGAFERSSFGFSGRPANQGATLATLVDASAAFTLTKNMSFNAYIGRALGGPVIDRIYPRGGDGTLGYLEAEFRR